MAVRFGCLKNLKFFLEREVEGLSVELVRTPTRLEGDCLYLWLGDFGVKSPSAESRVKLKREHYSLLSKYLGLPVIEVKRSLSSVYKDVYKPVIYEKSFFRVFCERFF